MKITLKKSFAVILALVMCVSVLFGMNLSAFAAETNTVTYVKDGTYVYNWGTRGTTATFLSPMASKFYGDKNISLDALLALDGSANTSNVPDSALYDALYNLMATSTYTSYDSTKNYFKYTDCQNSDGAISSFYSGVSVGPTWDGTFNREHVWPNSKSNGGSDTNTRRETDIMMLRPTATTENSGRGNTAYGKSSGYFNPNNYVGSTGYDLRGDVARIVLYVYVRWGGDATYHDGALNFMWGSSGVIESKDVLIEWMEADPVDTWEMGRNDSTEAILGTRNVFVDYPELAFDLFNEAVPTNYTSPSGGTSVEGTTGTGGSGSTGGDYEIAAEATITFDNTAKRTSVSTTQQTWTENGIVFTNNKGSGSDINESYFNPVRVYKNSEVVIAYDKAIAKIDFATSGSSYATALETTLSTYGTITTSGNTVTLVLSQPTKTFTFTNSGGATRFNSITVYATDEVVDPDPEEPTPDPDPEEPTPDTPDEPITGTETEVTINFGTTIQRVSWDSNSQVWSNEDLTFTNNKASSSNDIIDSSNPVRIYAHSSVTLEHTNGIKSITFAADNATYATALTNSIGTPTGATVTKDGNNITVTFENAVKSYNIADITAQVRLDSITAVVLVNTDAPTVTVTAQANNDTYGTVEVSGKYIIATPKSGYEIDETNPYTIISGTATVTQSGNSFAVTADADVTIQINFVEREKAEVKYYQHGDLAFTEKVNVGDNTTLPTHFGNVPLGWTFAGWTTTEISGETTTEPTVLASKSNYTVNADTNLYAVYYYSKTETVESTTQGGKAYEKVTSAPADWSGTYLIVYETGKVAFDGSRTTLDAASNTISVAINNNKIESNTTTDASTFTITKSGSNYLVQSKSGYYIGNTSSSKNQLQSSKTTKYTNTISIDSNGNVSIIASAGYYLRYNKDSGQTRFRYYKSTSTYPLVSLYKLVETTGESTTTTTTVNYYFTNRAFTDNETQGYYVKVTEDLTDWSGDYLVVFEGTDKKADAVFDGSRPTLDEAHNILNGVSANGGAIKAKQSIDAAKITITKSGDKYAIKANGKYIAPTSGANGITVGTENLHTIAFADGKVDIIGSTGSYLRFNSDNGKNNYRFRYYQASSYQNQAAITLYKWIPLEAAITGAQVTVGADLSINYYTNITGVDNVNEYELTMRFSIDDTVIDTVAGAVVDSQYVFDFAGLAPQRMSDIIKAELLINGGVIAVKDNYSIKTNAQNLLTENAGNAELCQFITDMLYYGAAAQKYTKYNTDNLATDGITGLGTPSTATPTETNNAFDLSATTGDAGFKSATVWFDVTNKLIVKVSKKTEDVNVKVYVTPDGGTKTELSYNDTVGGYMTDEIKVTDFHNAFVFELCDGEGNAIQTLTYSVNSYAYSIYKKYESDDTSAMKALALALFRLGQSAENL